MMAAARPPSAASLFTRMRVVDMEATVNLNPEPQASLELEEAAAEEELAAVLEGHLSSEKLMQISGSQNLESVKFLEMRVDTTHSTLGNFGAHLPSLKQLKINNSIVSSIRDMGSSLKNLSVLWMSRCELNDLDGIVALESLQELFVSYNCISDLSPLSMLEHLETLDLEGNNVDDIHQVEYLALIPTLTTLTLEDNPITKNCTIDGEWCKLSSLADSESNNSTRSRNRTVGIDDQDDENEASTIAYRMRVCRLLPQLRSLDDVPVTAEDKELPPSTGSGWISSESSSSTVISETQKTLTRPTSALKRIKESEARLISRSKDKMSKEAIDADDETHEISLLATAISFSRGISDSEPQSISSAKQLAQKLISGKVASPEGDGISGDIGKNSENGNSDSVALIGARPRSAAQRSSYRVQSLSNSKVSSLSGQRPLSARSGRPGSAVSSISSSSRSYVRDDDDEDYSSELTHGTDTIICGNPIISLRSRRASRHS